MNTKLNPIVTSNLPSGFTARAGKLSDYMAAFELMNAYSLHINGCIDTTDPELVRLDWLNAGFNPETDLHIVFGADGKMVGLAESWHTHLPPVHPWNWIVVHPEHFEDGIWEYLLEWAEERSAKALEHVP